MKLKTPQLHVQLLTLLVTASVPAMSKDFIDANSDNLQTGVLTGSRLVRKDVHTVLPVTIITREQIELSGESNAADLLRNLIFNSAGSFRPKSGSATQGEASVDFRGIGTSRSLVLIDGRRLPKAPGTGSNQDLNMIPMGAIERIEVLPHAATSIYGSDALAGVVNVITRSDFQGAEIMLGGAEVSITDNGGEREEGSIVFGVKGDRSSIIAGISWNDREIILDREIPWETGRGESLWGNNFSITNLSGSVSFNFIPTHPDACDQSRPGFYLSNGLCRYDFTQVSASEASIENKSFYTKVSYEINDQWSLFTHAKVLTTQSFGRFASVPDSRFFDTPFDQVYSPLSITSPNNPTNPLSPMFNPALGLSPREVDWFHRFDALGPRDSTVGTTLTDLLIGTTGTIGRAEVEFGVRHTNNVRTDVGRNYLLRSVAQQLIESGEYDMSNPYGNPDVIQRMKISIFRDSKYDQNEIYSNARFDFFEMANGPVSMVIGAEHRTEKYADIYDPQSLSGAVGGSAGNSAGGNREINAVYFETLLPILDNLEFVLAGRYDDYSDFNSEFTPRFSFRWQLIDQITIRGLYEQGHHLPSLDIMTQSPSTGSITVSDPATCIAQGLAPNCRTTVLSTSRANPLLEVENSEHFTLGISYQPLTGVNINFDFWHNQIDNRIRSFSSQYLIDYAESLPTGLLGCERDFTGFITHCFSGYGNRGSIQYSGLDLDSTLSYQLMSGSIKHQLSISHFLDYTIDHSRDILNSPGVPQDRVALNNSYSINNWQFSYNLNLIGSQYANGSAGNYSGHIPTWVTHDLQANYHTPWNGKVTIGVQNLGEKLPPLNSATGNQRYNFNLYHGFGRISYIRYSQRF